ncbi:MAG: glycerophosphodiester phosphodiesterase family protein [Opitutaceae bacterium]|jgi:glycerophosphoryl diester phosphodiesterase|nr:glycerophosphodiester phosphodiesterase family protein [Opitutaceae bacterium]
MKIIPECFLCALIALLLCPPTALAENPPPAPDAAAAPRPNYTLVLGADAGPRVKSAAAWLEKVLQNAAKKNTTAPAADTPAPAREILIGDTGHPESAALAATFATPMDYALQITNGKIVATGGCGPATVNAVRALAGRLVKGALDGRKDGLIYKWSFPARHLNPLINDPSAFVPSWAADWRPPAWMLDFDEKLRAISKSSKRLMCISHRGDMVYYPENSAEGYLSAIMAGADAIEMDARLTRDNVLVMMHDKTLARTTNFNAMRGKDGLPASPRIRDWTYEQLTRLNLVRADGEVTPYKIPTLYETLRICAGRVFALVDIKIDMWASEDIFPISRMASSLPCHLYSVFTSTRGMLGEEYKAQVNNWTSVYNWGKPRLPGGSIQQNQLETFASYMKSGGRIRGRTWARLSETAPLSEIPEVWATFKPKGKRTLLYSNRTVDFCKYIAATSSPEIASPAGAGGK